MEPRQELNRNMMRMLLVGIVMVLCGLISQVPFLAVIGCMVILASLIGFGGIAKRSDLPGYQPPRQTEWTGMARPVPPNPQPSGAQPAEDAASGLYPPSPWKLSAGDFDVVLLSPGPVQERVIGWIAAAFGISLEEAAMLTAKRMTAIRSGISGADASQIESALERLGANVDVVRRTVPKTPRTSNYADQIKRQVQDLSSTVGAIARQRKQPPGPVTLQGHFDAVLTDPGKDKIATRKALKTALSLDLLQAYNAVEQLPYVLKTGITQAEAERIRAQLEAVGAKIEFRPASSGNTE